MLHGIVSATGTRVRVVHAPLKTLASTLLAHIRGKRCNVQEADETEELANAILQRSSGQTPTVVDFQGKSSLSGHRGTGLDAVGLVLYFGQHSAVDEVLKDGHLRGSRGGTE